MIGWFRQMVADQGGGNDQTMMNDALRAYMQGQNEPLEAILRHVVREELQVCQPDH